MFALGGSTVENIRAFLCLGILLRPHVQGTTGIASTYSEERGVESTLWEAKVAGMREDLKVVINFPPKPIKQTSNKMVTKVTPDT